MNVYEFIVELLRIYSGFLTAVLWPSVALILFFSIFVYLDRFLGMFSKKKRVPLTWKTMENMLRQLEHEQLLHNGSSKRNQRRQLLVASELQIAQQALANKDEKQLMKSMLTLSALAMHNDQELTQLDGRKEPEPELPKAEIILPVEEPPRPPQG